MFAGLLASTRLSLLRLDGELEALVRMDGHGAREPWYTGVVHLPRKLQHEAGMASWCPVVNFGGSMIITLGVLALLALAAFKAKEV